MAVDDSREESLLELHRAYTRIDSVETPPKTTLEVLRREQREEYWNRLFQYFLDPTEPHGFGTLVLTAFLKLIEGQYDSFSFDRFGVDDISVEREVGTPNGNRADIILRFETEWFVWVEMKVKSKEGVEQTTGYVDDPYVGETRKDEFPDNGRVYLYLTPFGHPSSANEFIDIDWGTVAETLRHVQVTGVEKHPLRSHAQFADFLDTIRNETRMTPHEENQREKTELAIEYYDSITDVLDTLTDVVAEHQENWPTEFEPFAPTRWDEVWCCKPGNRYGTFFKRSWPEVDENPVEDADKTDPIRPYFEHLLSEEQVAKGEFQIRTQVTGSNEELRQQFDDYLYSSEVQKRIQSTADEIESRPGCTLEIPARDSKTFTRYTIATYPFEWEGGEGYYRTLSRALDDHEELIAIFDEAVERLNH